MRILLALHHVLDPNQGASGATLDLGAALQERGHDVDYFGFESVDSHLPNKLKGVVFPLALTRYLLGRRNAYDVVDGASGDLSVTLALRRVWPGRLAFVTRSHGLESTSYAQLMEEVARRETAVRRRYRVYHGKVRLPAEAYATRASDITLFLNAADRQFGIERLHVRPDRAHVVANGVMASLLGREPEQLASDEVRVAQIGTYIPRKGTRFGTPAIVAAMAVEPRLAVTFLGTGVQESAILDDFPREMHPRIRVVPRYNREDLGEHLAGHAIKFFPTNSEGFSVALVEAMALGLAPIVTATPGPLEVIRDGMNGVVVPPRDTSAMTAALLRLARDETLRERLRVAACATAQRYSWPQIAGQTETLYGQAREFAASR